MLKKPDVYFTGRSFTEDEVRDKMVVVIDVLRAASTIVTALQNGSKGVIAVDNMADASRIAQNLDPTSYLLCGEKDGKKIEGYHLGNSPFEYDTNIIEQKTLLLNTTNGTRAIHRSSSADTLIIGCFLNVSAVVDTLRNADKEIIIICSGWKNRLSFEDLLCAGYIISKLNNGVLASDTPDGAQVAFALFDQFGSDIPKVISRCNHAIRLKDIGYEKDVDYCCQIDTHKIVPELRDGIII